MTASLLCRSRLKQDSSLIKHWSKSISQRFVDHYEDPYDQILQTLIPVSNNPHAVAAPWVNSIYILSTGNLRLKKLCPSYTRWHNIRLIQRPPLFNAWEMYRQYCTNDIHIHFQIEHFFLLYISDPKYVEYFEKAYAFLDDVTFGLKWTMPEIKNVTSEFKVRSAIECGIQCKWNSTYVAWQVEHKKAETNCLHLSSYE